MLSSVLCGSAKIKFIAKADSGDRSISILNEKTGEAKIKRTKL
jgi:hypothetical protein